MSSSHLLLIDDDVVYNDVLARALTRRGFNVTSAHTLEQGLIQAEKAMPHYIVLDLNLNGRSSLNPIPSLLDISPKAKILVMTSHASIPAAVKAVRLGAWDYLAKPAPVRVIVSALTSVGMEMGSDREATNKYMSVQRLEWEYIQRVLMEHDGNIAATARALAMHRRTLQRKLVKRPPAG